MLTLVVMSMLSLAGIQAAERVEPTAAPAPSPAAEAPAPYSYNPEGRRDPFVSLIGRGIAAVPPPGARAPGVSGLLVAETTVKGIVRDRSGFLAMLQAPDKKTYIVRPGDKLLDGVVKTITQEAVIFSQDVGDPLSLVKQREVSKRVRAADDQG